MYKRQALKNTIRGYVEVFYEIDKHCVRIGVKDTGRGIPQNMSVSYTHLDVYKRQPLHCFYCRIGGYFTQGTGECQRILRHFRRPCICLLYTSESL